MDSKNRFHDENALLSDFFSEVLVVCPACSKKAMAKVDFEAKMARLFCIACGYNKKKSTLISGTASLQMPANQYFEAALWLKSSFKKELFYAFNKNHLDYLERYITAILREHKDRTHFTFIEKLPKFYHEAKNRDGLLKIIAKLKATL